MYDLVSYSYKLVGLGPAFTQHISSLPTGGNCGLQDRKSTGSYCKSLLCYVLVRYSTTIFHGRDVTLW